MKKICAEHACFSFFLLSLSLLRHKQQQPQRPHSSPHERVMYFRVKGARLKITLGTVVNGGCPLLDCLLKRRQKRGRDSKPVKH